VEAAVELVEARDGTLGVLDETWNRLSELITPARMTPLDSRSVGCPRAWPAGVDHSGCSAVAPNLHEHSGSVGFPPGHPAMTLCLGVSLRVRDEVFGNLYLTNKTTGEVFTDVNEELALASASAAAVAIDNARLFDRGIPGLATTSLTHAQLPVQRRVRWSAR
jgi:GAF domain-containing protein